MRQQKRREMREQTRNKINTVKDLGTSGWVHFINLEFNAERGDWDVIIRRHKWFTPIMETVTAYFHTLEDAKACVERNKKMWATMKIPYIDENGVGHTLEEFK